jgi:hypothetical protein
MSTQTGIEIEVFLPTNEKFHQLLHALHLQVIDKAMSATEDWGLGKAKLAVVLDGKETELPLRGPHFVECGAGKHRLEVAVGDFLGALSPGKAMTKKSIEVEVAANQVTEVHFFIKGGGVTRLEAVGKRAE